MQAYNFIYRHWNLDSIYLHVSIIVLFKIISRFKNIYFKNYTFSSWAQEKQKMDKIWFSGDGVFPP